MTRPLKNRGFTLIELLVVIAIIGILSSIILASLSSSHSRGRDTKRVSDLNQLRLALQIYYDANQSYPSGSGKVGSTLGTLSSNNYISVLPIDPSGGSADYEYIATPSGCSGPGCIGYILAAQLESDASGLNGYNTANTPTFDINALTGVNCTQTGSPNFIYCVRP